MKYPKKYPLDEQYKGTLLLGQTITPETIFGSASGAPYFNSNGEVVGIHSYIRKPIEYENKKIVPCIAANVGGLERVIRK